MSAAAADTKMKPPATPQDDDVPQPIPNMALQQLHFALLNPRTTDAERQALQEELLKGIEKDGE